MSPLKPSSVRPTLRGLPFAARLGACIASLLVVAGCQSQGPDLPSASAQPPTALPSPASPVTPPPMAGSGAQDDATLQSQIRAEIGTAACTSNTQCRTLPLGAQACGGPQAWLAWSTAVSREATLNTLSEQLSALQRQRNAQNRMVSTCQFKADPGAWCPAQQCVLRAPGAAP